MHAEVEVADARQPEHQARRFATGAAGPLPASQQVALDPGRGDIASQMGGVGHLLT